jgi:hypothetical protein
MIKLYWNTVSSALRNALITLMSREELSQFRLVGGTALSLQIGHRISVDIDLFTDAPYESVDFAKIDSMLNELFPYVSNTGKGPVGIGRFYTIGNTIDDAIKLDILYTDPYIQPPLEIDGIRIATIDEIIAMKIDIIQRGGRKKDFWDLHELIDKFPLQHMIALHASRYPYNHEEMLIRKNLTDFELADGEADPNCLHGKHWELIKLDFLHFAKQKKSA